VAFQSKDQSINREMLVRPDFSLGRTTS